jgi:hypothetical protein
MRLLLIGFLLLAPAAYPQTSPAPATSSPQAVALANQALATLTGSIQVNDVTLTGTGTRTAGSDVESGSVSLKALAGGESRLDLTVAGGTRSEIRNLDSNGASQGFWIGLDGTAHSMANHNCATDAAWFFPALSALSQLSNPNLIVTYIGNETKGGANVQHLHFVIQNPVASGLFQQLGAEDIYLNASTNLPVAITFYAHPDNDASANLLVEVDYSNYQAVNGVQVPFRIQRLLNGTVLFDLAVQSATLNSGLTSAAFSPN